MSRPDALHYRDDDVTVESPVKSFALSTSCPTTAFILLVISCLVASNRHLQIQIGELQTEVRGLQVLIESHASIAHDDLRSNMTVLKRLGEENRRLQSEVRGLQELVESHASIAQDHHRLNMTALVHIGEEYHHLQVELRGLQTEVSGLQELVESHASIAQDQLRWNMTVLERHLEGLVQEEEEEEEEEEEQTFLPCSRAELYRNIGTLLLGDLSKVKEAFKYMLREAHSPYYMRHQNPDCPPTTWSGLPEELGLL